jgi:nucleoid-associated protein YgaU
MITSNSRYAASTVVTVETVAGKDVQAIVPSAAVSYTFSYVFYTATPGDRIDKIANAFYSDPTRWWVIADANPEIMDWTAIPGGTTIRIPNA